MPETNLLLKDMQVLSNYWIPTVRTTNNLASVNSKDCTKKDNNILRSGKVPSNFYAPGTCIKSTTLPKVAHWII